MYKILKTILAVPLFVIGVVAVLFVLAIGRILGLSYATTFQIADGQIPDKW